MIKQTLLFNTPKNLSLRYNQLVIADRETPNVVTRPIEDIGVLIVEHPQVHFTVPLLNALADQNVSVVFCDERMMPKSMLMPLEGNNTMQESYQSQMEASEPLKKQIWKQLIEQKIRNQSAVLQSVGREGNVLRPYYMNVKSGDTDNREGAAARIYWQQLFGSAFRREREGDPPNNFLNYGYAILRAAVARALVGSGLYPAFGIFHRNRYNAFPLADDVMEPYRPFVDEIVYRLYFDGAESVLDNVTKSHLLRVLFSDVSIGQVTRPLEIALSITTASLTRMYRKETNTLSLPSFP